MSILVTRPQPHGNPLCESLNHAGLHSIFFPTIDIIPQQNKETHQFIKQLDHVDIIIFVSPNAVLHSIDIIKKFWKILPSQLKIAAIGSGTAGVLLEHGITAHFYPTQNFNSESLLAMPQLQHVENKKILIVRGKGGKKTLAAKLIQRGAKIQHAIVYKRQMPHIQSNSLTKIFNENTIELIVSTSEECLNNLWQLASTPEKTLLSDSQLLVISQGMVNLAKSLGFKLSPILTPNAQNETIIASILSRMK